MSNSSSSRTVGQSPTQPALSRRGLIAGAAALGASIPLGIAAQRAFAAPGLTLPPELSGSAICKAVDTGPGVTGPLKKINLAWNAGASCLVGITVAKEKGFFTKHGLDVELVNFAGSTDQLLETLATGKSDAAVGMALRWLKPLEGGFDVKIVGSTHGGCLRLLAPVSGGIKDIRDLKGKVIAVSDMNSPSKLLLGAAQEGRPNPLTDVEFKLFPSPLLRAAVEKGEAHALAENDPIAYMWTKDGQFAEVSSNLTGEYEHRVCCIIGVRGSLLREDKAAAASIVRALIDAAEFSHQNPAEAAETYLPFTAGKATKEDITALAKYHTHGHHPLGEDLKKELVLYADELKLVNVMRASTDWRNTPRASTPMC